MLLTCFSLELTAANIESHYFKKDMAAINDEVSIKNDVGNKKLNSYLQMLNIGLSSLETSNPMTLKPTAINGELLDPKLHVSCLRVVEALASHVSCFHFNQ